MSPLNPTTIVQASERFAEDVSYWRTGCRMILADASAWVEFIRGTTGPADIRIAGLLGIDLDGASLIP